MHSEHLEDDVVTHNVYVDMSNWKYMCFDKSHTLDGYFMTQKTSSDSNCAEISVLLSIDWIYSDCMFVVISAVEKKRKENIFLKPLFLICTWHSKLELIEVNASQAVFHKRPRQTLSCLPQWIKDVGAWCLPGATLFHVICFQCMSVVNHSLERDRTMGPF